MPYIKKDDRCKFTIIMHYLKHYKLIRSVGELNYLITSICKHYLEQEGEKYTNHNAIIGALECVKQEFYRRRTSPYEDKKIKENGDV
jgi:hypothetical protein